MPLSSQEQDNATRWKPGKKPFYEVYYIKLNDPTQEMAAWLRYTLLAPLNFQDPQKVEPDVAVWGVFFDAKDSANHVGIKNTFPLHESRIEREIFYFSAGPSAIFDAGARGDISDGKNKMSWELKFEEGLSLHHYPAPLYFEGFHTTKLLAPYLSTPISGEFQMNDRKFVLNRVPGHQAHLWGREQAASWVWGNCNAFEEDAGFCFEGFSARPVLGGHTAPPITCLFFSWEGQLYKFNSPQNWLKNKSFCELGRWHFEAGHKDLLFVGDFMASPEDIVGLRYQDTVPGESFCHNTKIADLKIQILRKEKSGWQSIRTVTASRTAALEIVQPKLDERVRLLIP